MQNEFLGQLPGQIAYLESYWKSLLKEGWDTNKLAKLYQRIQVLAESSDEVGLSEVSDRVFSLEVYISSFTEGKIVPNEKQQGEIERLFQALKEVALVDQEEEIPAELEEKISYPDTKGKAMVLYVSQGAEPIPGLVQLLQQRDFFVWEVNNDSPIPLKKEALPVAVLLDAARLTKAEEKARITALRQQWPENPAPLICVTSASNLTVRVQAMRLGAEAYFIKPSTAEEVADRLAELVQPKEVAPHRILVVDDNASHARFARAILRKAGMDTEIVTEPLKTMEALDTFQPDLILMDIYMPDCNGIELTTIIRERRDWANTPIVFLSGEDDTDKQFDALSVGGDDFLAKPIRPRHLISTVRNRVRRIRQLQGPARSVSSPAAAVPPESGLLNRSEFLERLTTALETATSGSGLLYIGLDAQSKLLEKAGIVGTDTILTTIGKLLIEQSNSQDVCARFRDNFMFLVQRTEETQLLSFAEQLCEMVAKQVFDLGDLSLSATISVGLCDFQYKHGDTSAFISRSEQALRVAQKQGNCVTEYAPATDATGGLGDDWLTQKIDQALQDDGFQILYQPIVGLRGGGEAQFQAILNLPNEGGPTLLAETFVPVASRYGNIAKIDRWIVEQSLRTVDERQRSGQDVRLFIPQRVSVLLQDKEFIPWMLHRFRAFPMSVRALVFELNTQELSTKLKEAQEGMATLKRSAVQFCLTGFGQEAAEFQLLQHLPVGYLKLDKKFAAGGEELNQLVSSAHEKKLRVIVPGIDDARNIVQLWASGTDYIQGDFIQHPHETLDFDFSGAVM